MRKNQTLETKQRYALKHKKVQVVYSKFSCPSTLFKTRLTLRGCTACTRSRACLVGYQILWGTRVPNMVLVILGYIPEYSPSTPRVYTLPISWSYSGIYPSTTGEHTVLTFGNLGCIPEYSQSIYPTNVLVVLRYIPGVPPEYIPYLVPMYWSYSCIYLRTPRVYTLLIFRPYSGIDPGTPRVYCTQLMFWPYSVRTGTSRVYTLQNILATLGYVPGCPQRM